MEVANTVVSDKFDDVKETLEENFDSLDENFDLLEDDTNVKFGRKIYIQKLCCN